MAHTVWQRPWLATAMQPLAWGYCATVGLRNRAYNTGILPAYWPAEPSPLIISVGNLTVGGTGKTPVVTALAHYFAQQGRRVVVLSRGYGGEHHEPVARVTSPSQGDEPFLIQSQVPGARVIVGPDRVRAANGALKEAPADIILLDDGFQHRRLKRHIELVLIDAETGLGNGHLLPAGPLREPITSLGRASYVLLTRFDTHKLAHHDRLAAITQQCLDAGWPAQVVPVPFATDTACPLLGDGEAQPLEALLKNRPLVSICGLARPEAFEAGVQPDHAIRFSDHHAYTAQQLASLPVPKEATVVTTWKDAVKWQALPREAQPDWFTRTWVVDLQACLPDSLLRQLAEAHP